MKLVTIEGSSNVDGIGYDPQTQEMQVRFKGGKTYTHADVTPLKHAAFVAAKSKGSHYHENFRGKHGVAQVGGAKKPGAPNVG